MDSGFQSLVGFQILELYSGFQSPRFQILQAKFPPILESGFPYMGRTVSITRGRGGRGGGGDGTPEALSICQNWPAGPLSDQSVWKWNRLFPRVFAAKLSPSCILFKIWLLWLDSFWSKVKFSLRRERSGRSVETNGKRPQSHSSHTTVRWTSFFVH